MKNIYELLQAIEIGDRVELDGFGFYPILIRDEVVRDEEYEEYETIYDALKNGTAKIYEEETPQVPEVIVEVLGEKKVIIPEGFIIKGGKQTRVISITIVLSKGKHNIGVFCVERGRWSGSREFKDVIVMDSVSRAIKNLTMNQGVIWDFIDILYRVLEDDKDYRESFSSPFGFESTRSYEGIYNKLYSNIRWVEGYNPGEKEIGVVFGDNELHIEFFESPNIWKKLARQTLTSHLMGEIISQKLKKRGISIIDRFGIDFNTTLSSRNINENNKVLYSKYATGIISNPYVYFAIIPHEPNLSEERLKLLLSLSDKHPENFDIKEAYEYIYNFHKNKKSPWYLVPIRNFISYLEFVNLMPKPSKASDADMYATFVHSLSGILNWAIFYDKNILQKAYFGLRAIEEKHNIPKLGKTTILSMIENPGKMMELKLLALYEFLKDNPMYANSIFYKQSVKMLSSEDIKDNIREYIRRLVWI